MTAPFPIVVQQALDDTTLPHTARLMMWHLAKRLDLSEYREVKLSSLAHEMRCKETTTGQALATLVERGYLDQRPIERRSRAYRLPWSRRTARAMAA
jgi:DNA-binding MarR family transcriptional regulator